MALTIDGVNPRTYGVKIGEVSGWLDDVPKKHHSVVIPGRPGEIALGRAPDVPPRDIVVKAVIEGTGATLALRAASARTRLDQFTALLRRGDPSRTLAVIFDDIPTKQLYAVCTQVSVSPPAAQMVADTLPLEFRLKAFDPYLYDVTETVLALNSSLGIPTPLGTAPVRPLITLTMLASTYVNPDFALRDSAGIVVGGLSLLTTLAAGDVLAIDSAAGVVRLNNVVRMDLIAGGDFFTLDVDAHGNYLTSAWPKIGPTIINNTNYSAVATYRKAWR